MSTFKVGDKVKYVGNHHDYYNGGTIPKIKEGVVDVVGEDYVRVKTEDYYFTCFDINLELIQDEKAVEVEEKNSPSIENYRDKEDDYSYYKYSYKGIKLDPYRILSVYNITCPAQQHAIKKLLRAGNSVKELKQDIQEVIDTLQRKLEMLKEDEGRVSEDDNLKGYCGYGETSR